MYHYNTKVTTRWNKTARTSAGKILYIQNSTWKNVALVSLANPCRRDCQFNDTVTKTFLTKHPTCPHCRYQMSLRVSTKHTACSNNFCTIGNNNLIWRNKSKMQNKICLHDALSPWKVWKWSIFLKMKP